MTMLQKARCRAQALRHDKRGVAAVLFALTVPVLVGAGALAVDISMYRYVDGRLQSAADAAALAAVGRIDNPSAAIVEGVDYAARNVPASFGTVATAGDIAIGIFNDEDKSFVVSTGSDVNAVRVTAARSDARGNAVPQVLSGIFGPRSTAIAATAIAARQLQVQYLPPERTDLDAEAGDFNEIYAYCYKYAGTGTPASRRSQMTLISNNMGAQNIIAISGGVINAVPQSPLVWPECGKGESISFRMRNIRHAKNQPALWANPNSQPYGRPEFNYYTDTEIVNGVEVFRIRRNTSTTPLTGNMVETIRCDSLNQCDPKKPGNIIPKGKDRTVTPTSAPCLPGKFMYFGWEDRPPGQSGKKGTWTDPAWTDRDFDDIVIVMKCPSIGRLGDGMSRLVG